MNENMKNWPQTSAFTLQKFENKNRTTLSLFSYSKFWNSEISVVLHLVVPNIDPHSYLDQSRKKLGLILACVRAL